MIEVDTDVLITHGPPMGYGDSVYRMDWDGKVRSENVGCENLLNTIKVIKPSFHVCGHIHGGNGVYPMGNTKVINASVCTERYDPTQQPIVFNIKEKIK